MNNLQDYFRPQGSGKPENREAPSPHPDGWPSPHPDGWPSANWPPPDGWPQSDTWPGADHPYEVFSGPDVEFLNGRWGNEAELSQLLEGGEGPERDHSRPPFGLAAPHREPLVGPRHRKIRTPRTPTPRRTPDRVEALSFAIAIVTAAIVTLVGVLCGTVTHGPLRQLAAPEAPRRVAEWWPLLVYGPWLVASLSILRAALHHRRAPHSWCVVVLFSVFAVMLCVARAPMTLTGVAVAGLPPLATLACFHQLVRQITLTRPPRRAPADRHGTGGRPSPVR